MFPTPKLAELSFAWMLLSAFDFITTSSFEAAPSLFGSVGYFTLEGVLTAVGSELQRSVTYSFLGYCSCCVC